MSALENRDLIPIGSKRVFAIGSKRTDLLRQLRTFIEFKHKLYSIIPKNNHIFCNIFCQLFFFESSNTKLKKYHRKEKCEENLPTITKASLWR